MNACKAYWKLHQTHKKSGESSFYELFYINQIVFSDTQDQAGQTPLHLALRRSHTEIALLLITKGCNFDLADEVIFEKRLFLKSLWTMF